jgi:hypothetical protein
MKHKVETIPAEEILANRSNAYKFIDFDKQEITYSEQEVFVLLLKHQSDYRSAVRRTSPLDWSFDVQSWFERFKKK